MKERYLSDIALFAVMEVERRLASPHLLLHILNRIRVRLKHDVYFGLNEEGSCKRKKAGDGD